MLGAWDFKDPLINSTTPQINRQKSARNLTVIMIDKPNTTGVFWDAKKGTRTTATLAKCDCKDFNFSGNASRKTFKPCMHIYRLAMELGLLEREVRRPSGNRNENCSAKRIGDAATSISKPRPNSVGRVGQVSA